MVGMMRAHMADPHIVRKLEAGQADRIRACVGASYCINRLYLGLDSLCIQNPATGREETIPQLIAPSGRPAPTGRGRGRRTGRPGGGPGGRRARARRRPARGRARARRPGPARGAGHAPAGGPHGHRRLARRRMPACSGSTSGATPWPTARTSPRSSRTSSSSRPAAGRDCRPSPRARTWSSAPGTSSAGPRRRHRGEVLVYDDHGTEEALSCAERLVAAGSRGRDRVTRSPRRPGGDRDGLPAPT